VAGLVGVALLLVASGAAAREPRGSAVRDPGPATRELAGACREQVAAELRRGELAASGGCESERRSAQRRQLQTSRTRAGFGLVERARVELTGSSLLLSEGRGCSRWPLRLPQRQALGLYEAKAAGCWIRRYSGPVTVAGVLPDGRRVPGLQQLRAVEGHAELDLPALAVSLERRGLPGLDAFVSLELGADGWAGSFDLTAQRARLADMHATAVQRGRGVAALMVVRHPEHPAADAVRALALTMTLRRQEQDFHAVERGELSVYRFLERHAWSPYRHLVVAMGAVRE
jgi:phage tail tube protein FII